MQLDENVDNEEKIRIIDQRQPNFFWLDISVCDKYGKSLDGCTFKVYVYLARLSVGFGDVEISYRDLADMIGMSRSKTIESIEELIVVGMIEKRPGKIIDGMSSPNRFVLLNVQQNQESILRTSMPELLYLNKKIVDSKKEEEGESEGGHEIQLQLPSEAVALSQKLADSLVALSSMMTKPTPGSIKRWAKDCDRLHRLDGHSWDEIEDVLAFAMKHHFWQTVVQSMVNVRKNWNRIVADMTKGNGKKTTGYVPFVP